jgi:hypothetical protein
MKRVTTPTTPFSDEPSSLERDVIDLISPPGERLDEETQALLADLHRESHIRRGEE